MSVVIRLDGSALMALIGSDKTIRFELQRAVVAEVVKKVFLNDFSTVLEQVQSELMKELRDAVLEDEDVRNLMQQRLSALVRSVRDGAVSYRKSRTLPAEVNQLIAHEVDRLVHQSIKEAGLQVDNIVEKQTDNIRRDLDDRIRAAVDHNVARAVHSGVAKRLNEVLAELAERKSNE